MRTPGVTPTGSRLWQWGLATLLIFSLLAVGLLGALRDIPQTGKQSLAPVKQAPIDWYRSRVGEVTPASDHRLARAQVLAASGPVTVTRPSGSEQKLTIGEWLTEGDHLLLRGGAWVELRFPAGADVRVEGAAHVEMAGGQVVRTSHTEHPVALRLYWGRAWARVVHGMERMLRFAIETPSAVAGVRGTVFSVTVLGTETTVSVHQGTVEVASRTGAVEVTRGQATDVSSAAPYLHTARVQTLSERSAWRQRQTWLEQGQAWKEAFIQGQHEASGQEPGDSSGNPVQEPEGTESSTGPAPQPSNPPKPDARLDNRSGDRSGTPGSQPAPKPDARLDQPGTEPTSPSSPSGPQPKPDIRLPEPGSGENGQPRPKPDPRLDISDNVTSPSESEVSRDLGPKADIRLDGAPRGDPVDDPPPSAEPDPKPDIRLGD